jgi:hypothetical protein
MTFAVQTNSHCVPAGVVLDGTKWTNLHPALLARGPTVHAQVPSRAKSTFSYKTT